MKMSTKGRYALRVMIDLAENDGQGYIPLKDISARQDISVKYLESIIAKLCKSGLVLSSRGPQGGYKLSNNAKDYTVGSIIRAAEGSVAPTSCLEDTAGKCPKNNDCAAQKFWQGLYDVINNYIDSVTLEDLKRIIY